MSERPNILLVTTDQQRFDTVAELGNQFIHTPHLDWLARQGLAFTRAYADCPLCSPSRATIMTGKHAWNHGGLSNGGTPIAGNPTLPGLLARGGYQTQARGKMHFSPTRASYGFEHIEILPDYYRFMRRHYPQHRPKDHGIGENEMHPTLATVPESLSITRWTVDRSIDFLETRDPTRPFFLWTSFSKPHPPFDPPRSYWDIYDGIPMPEPVLGDWSADADKMPAGLMGPTWSLNNVDRFSREQLAATRRAYYACISQIDYNLGLLFARMRELDLLRNTWIVFTSDHGEMLGDHRMGGKSHFLEGSSHVPLLVRAPAADWTSDDRPRGHRCDAIACLADLMPTLLGIAGVDIPADHHVDGLDLLALHRGDVRRETLIAAGADDRFHMVLQGSMKYCFTPAGGHELLFDLAADPLERRDLSGSPQHSERLRSLREELLRHLMQRRHPAAKSGQLASTGEPLTRQRVHATGLWPGFHSTTDESTDLLH